MYFPRKDGLFGSYFFYEDIPDRKKMFSKSYSLERTHLKILNTKNQPCDEGDSKPNTTTCITRHLEKEVGCSMGTYGSDPKMERYHFLNESSCTFNQLCILGAITSTKWTNTPWCLERFNMPSTKRRFLNWQDACQNVISIITLPPHCVTLRTKELLIPQSIRLQIFMLRSQSPLGEMRSKSR